MSHFAPEWAKEQRTVEEKASPLVLGDRAEGSDGPDLPIDWTYVIGPENSPVVKIGHAVNVPKRLLELQTGNPAELMILWRTPGGKPLESVLHRKFHHLRLRGEWFDFRDQDPVATIWDAAASIGAAPKRVLYSRYPAPGDPDRDNPTYRPRRTEKCRPWTPAELAQAWLSPDDYNFWCFCDFPGHYCLLDAC